jgi:hypothetical protein
VDAEEAASIDEEESKRLFVAGLDEDSLLLIDAPSTC